jgi:hypothetical protein
MAVSLGSVVRYSTSGKDVSRSIVRIGYQETADGNKL